MLERFSRQRGERFTSGFQQLYNSPHSNVLERSIGAAKETVQVAVHTTVRFLPHIIESGVIVRRGSAILCE